MQQHECRFLDVNGVRIACQTGGPPEGAPVLVIMGLGGQMTDGPDALTSELHRRGFRSIRFDNRDAGRSTHLTEAGPPPAHHLIEEALSTGAPLPIPYTLMDMADDARGVLDALGIEQAHVAGGSMGGMIGTLLAAEHPERVASFAAIISTSGNPALPPGPAFAELARLGQPGVTEDEQLEYQWRLFEVLRGSAFAEDELTLRERLLSDRRRSSDPAGSARQSAAIMPYADRRPYLRRITAPTVIIQGGDDPMFPHAHGADMAANVRNARLVVIPGLGHELPDSAVPAVVDAIEDNIQRR
jgi:pimeloyl-ACP methyl ester carboxylesterase